MLGSIPRAGLAILDGCDCPMSLPELDLNSSPVQKLLDYHRLLRIVEVECRTVLDPQSLARLVALIQRRIQQLELPAAVELDHAREARGHAL